MIKRDGIMRDGPSLRYLKPASRFDENLMMFRDASTDRKWSFGSATFNGFVFTPPIFADYFAIASCWRV